MSHLGAFYSAGHVILVNWNGLLIKERNNEKISDFFNMNMDTEVREVISWFLDVNLGRPVFDSVGSNWPMKSTVLLHQKRLGVANIKVL